MRRAEARGVLEGMDDGQTNGINFKFYPIRLSVSNTDPISEPGGRGRAVCLKGDDGQTNGIKKFIQFVCPSRTPIRAGRARAREVLEQMDDGQTSVRLESAGRAGRARRCGCRDATWKKVGHWAYISAFIGTSIVDRHHHHRATMHWP